LTGGKDGSLKVWTKSFEPVQTLPLKYNIRSVSFDSGKILVGTKTSEILEVVYNKDVKIFLILKFLIKIVFKSFNTH
jgi:hypothetical protein